MESWGGGVRTSRMRQDTRFVEHVCNGGVYIEIKTQLEVGITKYGFE